MVKHDDEGDDDHGHDEGDDDQNHDDPVVKHDEDDDHGHDVGGQIKYNEYGAMNIVHHRNWRC